MKSKKIIATALLTSGLIIGSSAVALADSTPAPTTTNTSHSQAEQAAHAAALAAYKIALTQYRVALISNDISYRAAMDKYWSDWKIVSKAYWTAWQTSITTFRAARDAYEALLSPIQAARKSALDAAGTAFLAATVGTPTNDALNAALLAYHTATKAANATFNTAVSALGVEPVRDRKSVV